jgi:hypothetical protein
MATTDRNALETAAWKSKRCLSSAVDQVLLIKSCLSTDARRIRQLFYAVGDDLRQLHDRLTERCIFGNITLNPIAVGLQFSAQELKVANEIIDLPRGRSRDPAEQCAKLGCRHFAAAARGLVQRRLIVQILNILGRLPVYLVDFGGPNFGGPITGGSKWLGKIHSCTPAFIRSIPRASTIAMAVRKCDDFTAPQCSGAALSVIMVGRNALASGKIAGRTFARCENPHGYAASAAHDGPKPAVTFILTRVSIYET